MASFIKPSFAVLLLSALAACGGQQQESTPAAPSETPAASAPAESSAPAPASEASAVEASAPAASEPAQSADACETTVEANDQMQYNTQEISINKACQSFTVKLKHTGSAPKTSMGHNLVITKTADIDDVAKEAMAAGPDQGYLKADDARIIAHTDMIGGGEETNLTIDPSKLADGSYSFFCTFPGHSGVMRGTINVH